MVNSETLKQDMEIWWKKLDNPMTIAESVEDIKIGDVTFRSLGEKHIYYQKTKNTFTYIKTYQSIDPILNLMGEVVYPILDVYIDICHGRKHTTYKKVRCHCGC